MEEAKKRDHRRIGEEQKLFMINSYSPGANFFLQNGTRIYNKMQAIIRREYLLRGFQEVISPNMFNIDLWKTSGHYKNYMEHMFLLDVDNGKFGMKPMNCPGHCLIFGKDSRS